MFKLDVDRLRVMFTLEDRDLAIAFAEMEGFEIVTENSIRGKIPIGYQFNKLIQAPVGTIPPSQVSPGVWSYKVGYKRKIPANPRIAVTRSKKPRNVNPRIEDYLLN